MMLAEISHRAETSGMPTYLLRSVECTTVSKAILKSRAMTMTNWLIVGRLVMVCRIVMRSAVVEPDGWKAN